MIKHCPLASRRWLVGVLVLAAAGIWGDRLWDRPAFDDAAWRDTRGVEAVVLTCRPISRGYQLRCRVTNHDDRPAAVVVLEASVLDRDGRLQATNPLVDLRDLGPGQQQTLMVIVPTRTTVTGARAQLGVSLVDWRKP